jgi:hypothetical protein
MRTSATNWPVEKAPSAIARLNFFNVVDVAGIEELGPIEHERELSFGLDHRLDALGLQKQTCQREDILESRSLSGRL